MSNRLLVPKAKRTRAHFVPGVMPRPLPIIVDSGGGTVTPDVQTFDTGSGNYTIPAFNTLTIEVWGGGAAACGLKIGSPSDLVGVAQNPAASTVSGSGLTTMTAAAGTTNTSATFGLQSGATGGAASGGNTTNTNGGDAVASTNVSGTYSGSTGGAAPNGGTGGAPGVATQGSSGHDGADGSAPGAGGGGCAYRLNATNGATSGGSSGAYVKTVLNAGDIAVGTVLAWLVGQAGLATKSGGFLCYGGHGTAGRVKFTVA